MMFDTKTNLLSFVDPKLWPFKSWRYPKNAKISKAHNTAPRAPRAKKICISKFHPRGYLHAKNDQNRWDKGVKLLTSALECPLCVSTIFAADLFGVDLVLCRRLLSTVKCYFICLFPLTVSEQQTQEADLLSSSQLLKWCARFKPSQNAREKKINRRL